MVMKSATFLLAVCLAFSFAPARAADSFTMAFNSDWPPYSHGKGETVDGILPKLMHELVENRMGYRFEGTGAAWPHAQALVRRGRADAMVTVATAERLKYTNASSAVVYRLEMQPVVGLKGEAKRLLEVSPTVDSLRRLAVCDIVGNGWGKAFLSNNRIKYRVADTVRDCLELIEKAEAEVTLQAAATSHYEIAHLPQPAPVMVLPVTFGEMAFHLLVSKKSTLPETFLNDFDTALAEMISDGSYTRLINESITSHRQ